jgi:hypothetical protein
MTNEAPEIPGLILCAGMVHMDGASERLGRLRPHAAATRPPADQHPKDLWRSPGAARRAFPTTSPGRPHPTGGNAGRAADEREEDQTTRRYGDTVRSRRGLAGANADNP